MSACTVCIIQHTHTFTSPHPHTVTVTSLHPHTHTPTPTPPPPSMHTLQCLWAPLSFGLGSTYMMQFERQQIGLQWSNIHTHPVRPHPLETTPTAQSMTLSVHIIIIILRIVGYFQGCKKPVISLRSIFLTFMVIRLHASTDHMGGKICGWKFS